MAKLNSTTVTDLEINGTLVINGTEVTPKSAQTYTPNTADQTIPSGKYLVGNQVIKGDANLIPANIKKDVTIFGITGTLVDYATYDTSLPDAGSEQILSGYEAFSFQGVKVVGNIATMAALTSEFTPSSSAQTLTIPEKQYNATEQTITIKAVPSETKTVTAGTSAVDVNATSGKWMTKVTVNPTPSEAKTGIKASTSAAVVVTPTSGKLLSSVTIDAINLQAKTGITPTTSQQQITADNDYDGLSSVTIEPIPSQYIVPSGNIQLSAQTGTDVTAYATASVQSSVKSISSTRTNIGNYFNAGTAADYDVRIRGSLSVSTAGWIASGTSYGSYAYYKIIVGAVSTPTNQTAIVDSTPSLDGTTITLQASVTPELTTTGWVNDGTDTSQFIAGTVKIEATVPTEPKTVKSTTTEQTINPTSGKLISSITVQALTEYDGSYDI